MRALSRPLRALRRFWLRLLHTRWFMSRLGYPLSEAWQRAGEWQR